MSKRKLKISPQSLSFIDLFSELTNDDRVYIAKKCIGAKYSIDEVILSKKDQDTFVYFIISGSVRIIFFSESGKEITFRDQHTGEFFGEIAAIDHAPRSAHVVALEDSMIAVMTASDFLLLLHQYPPVMQKAFARLATLIRLLSDRIIEYSTLGVINRVHNELLKLAYDAQVKNNMARISPVPTHFEISNRISSHREAVTRELRQLTVNGLLRKSKNCLTITDVKKLEKIVRDTYQDWPPLVS
ncbi:MAG: Crp/Fnr family transcriptional regulator [Gammaproteobacteria bacterium]